MTPRERAVYAVLVEHFADAMPITRIRELAHEIVRTLDVVDAVPAPKSGR